MSGNLIKDRKPSPPAVPVSRLSGWRAERQATVRPRRTTRGTEDSEAHFMRKAAIWMILLAVAPLILFYILTFFYPELFQVWIAPA